MAIVEPRSNSNVSAVASQKDASTQTSNEPGKKRFTMAVGNSVLREKSADLEDYDAQSEVQMRNENYYGRQRDIRRISIVGVHGWFPQTRVVQTLFGEPVGTSEKLCEMMLHAVIEKFEDAQVQLIPLTNLGMSVRERTDASLMQIQAQPEYSEAVSNSDLLIVVAHSQGCVVSMLLLHKLLQKQLVCARRTRVAMVALAGIWHGPQIQLRSSIVIKYMETEAARELFEFCDATGTAEIVRDYWRAVEYVLEQGVSVVAVASWQDQVVPLYSSLMWAFHHPQITRMLYYADDSIAGDFVVQLVTFLVSLRNGQCFDYSLLAYLCLLCPDTFIGSLYGVEHSSVYHSTEVHAKALDTLLRMVDSSTVPQRLLVEPFRVDRTITSDMPYSSSYTVSWALHRILTEHAQSPDLQAIVKAYSEWQPPRQDQSAVKLKLKLVGLDLHAKMPAKL